MTHPLVSCAALTLCFACRADGGDGQGSADVADVAASAANFVHSSHPGDGPAFETELLAAAREYRDWARVSDRANFAPTQCFAPPPAGVLRSRSASLDTHGRKL